MFTKNEIRIASIGNVDSAKSTTISVVANNILDDGKGSARSKILKHPHEKDTGRTSSITQYYIETRKNTLGFIDLAGHEKKNLFYKGLINKIEKFVYQISSIY